MTNNDIIKREGYTAGALQVQEREDGAKSRKITGYAIMFGVPSVPLWSDSKSEAREIIDSGAITKELLDRCDIKFTMFHDRQQILARSVNGAGTLSYGVDEKGVYFEFEAPETAEGDKALELVRRGDLTGCSFAFFTRYNDDAYVGREIVRVDKKNQITYHVKAVTDVVDFTIAADPAYPSTSVSARELRELEEGQADKAQSETVATQVREMRAKSKLIL